MRKPARNKNTKKRFILKNYLADIFSGEHTSPDVNVAFLAISVLLILGVIYAFIANNYLTWISEPTLSNKTPTSVSFSADKTTLYENENYSFKIKYPNDWNMEIADTSFGEKNHFKIYPWEDDVNEDDARGYGLEIVIYSVESGLGSHMNLQRTLEEGWQKHYELKGNFLYEFDYIPVNQEKLSSEEIDNYYEVFKSILGSFEYLGDTSSGVTGDREGECVPTGCSSQLCSDKEINTTCEYLDHYACFKNAVCERQETGECGWSVDDALKACLSEL